MTIPRHVPFRGFDPYAEVPVVRRRLPHWRQICVTYFITFRLADSVPQSLLHQWRDERAAWLRSHPPPWRGDEQREYEERFSGRMQDWLDAGMGARHIRRSDVRGPNRALPVALRRGPLRYRCICADAEPRSRCDHTGTWL
jgi:hypothetical protein